MNADIVSFHRLMLVVHLRSLLKSLLHTSRQAGNHLRAAANFNPFSLPHVNFWMLNCRTVPMRFFFSLLHVSARFYCLLPSFGFFRVIRQARAAVRRDSLGEARGFERISRKLGLCIDHTHHGDGPPNESGLSAHLSVGIVLWRFRKSHRACSHSALHNGGCILYPITLVSVIISKAQGAAPHSTQRLF